LKQHKFDHSKYIFEETK